MRLAEEEGPRNSSWGHSSCFLSSLMPVEAIGRSLRYADERVERDSSHTGSSHFGDDPSHASRFARGSVTLIVVTETAWRPGWLFLGVNMLPYGESYS